MSLFRNISSSILLGLQIGSREANSALLAILVIVLTTWPFSVRWHTITYITVQVWVFRKRHQQHVVINLSPLFFFPRQEQMSSPDPLPTVHIIIPNCQTVSFYADNLHRKQTGWTTPSLPYRMEPFPFAPPQRYAKRVSP